MWFSVNPGDNALIHLQKPHRLSSPMATHSVTLEVNLISCICMITNFLSDSISDIDTVDPLVAEFRDHCGYGLSQWETMLLCNIVTHWLSPYPEWTLWIVNVCRNINMYFHWHMQFIDIEVVKVVENCLSRRQESIFLAQSILWLFVAWWCKEPRHQQLGIDIVCTNTCTSWRKIIFLLHIVNMAVWIHRWLWNDTFIETSNWYRLHKLLQNLGKLVLIWSPNFGTIN